MQSREPFSQDPGLSREQQSRTQSPFFTTYNYVTQWLQSTFPWFNSSTQPNISENAVDMDSSSVTNPELPQPLELKIGKRKVEDVHELEPSMKKSMPYYMQKNIIWLTSNTNQEIEMKNNENAEPIQYDADNPEDLLAFSKIANFTFLPHDEKIKVKRYIQRVMKIDKNAYGVFAGEDFSGEESIFLGWYTGKKISSLHAVTDISYVMGAYNSGRKNKKIYIDGKYEGNETSRYNSSDFQPNVRIIDNGDGRVFYETIKGVPIKKGHQFLVYYGDGYGADHGSDEMVALNPNDGGESSQILLTTRPYSKCPMRLPKEMAEFFELSDQDEFYVPTYFKYIFENKRPSLVIKDSDDLDISLLAKSFDSDQPLPMNKQKGITLLMIAAYLGNLEFIKWLVENGANINQQCSFTNHTAIFHILKSNLVQNKAEIILYLIEHNNPIRIDLACQDKHGLTPIHWCIQLGQLETIKQLMATKSDRVQAQLKKALACVTYKDELCPISYALHLGQTEIFRYLIQNYSLGKYHFFDLTNNLVSLVAACQSEAQLETVFAIIKEMNVTPQAFMNFINYLVAESNNFNLRVEITNKMLKVKLGDSHSLTFSIDAKKVKRVTNQVKEFTAIMKEKKLNSFSFDSSSLSIFSPQLQPNKTDSNLNFVKRTL